MNPNWHGLLKIYDIQLISKTGAVIWETHDLLNTLHGGGELFLLTAVFSDKSVIPVNFYFGLDNRTSITANQTMSSISGEPTTNGYSRQAVSPGGQFQVELSGSHYVAKAPITIFSANGGSWGPVKTLFLTNKADNSGYLIASVLLTSPVTIQDGSTLNVRMGLGLKDCP